MAVLYPEGKAGAIRTIGETAAISCRYCISGAMKPRHAASFRLAMRYPPKSDFNRGSDIMQTGVNKDGFAPVDWAEEDGESIFDQGEPVVDAEQLAAQREIEALRRQIALLRLRLSEIADQSGAVVRANVNWVDANAHAQLGDYPWVKLAGAFAATFLVSRVLRKLPLGLLVATLASSASARD
jgi:hypothetical protein